MPRVRADTPVWTRAAREADFTLRLPGGVPMFFRRIPAGEFIMGSRGSVWHDEEPRHRVVITRNFLLGTFPVTQEQYRAVASRCPALKKGQAPSHFKGSRRPAGEVSWDDAVAFCDWLTSWPELPRGIAAVRLPTEAEWEYACRAGTDTDYYSGDGDAALAEVGWHYGNSANETHPVDERPEAHRWGLHGMHGNVWEWCRDAYRPDAYRTRIEGVTDPQVTPKSDDQARVLRGGSWGNSAVGCRSAYRAGGRPDGRNWDVGFRVCLVPDPAAPPAEQPAKGAEAKPGRGDGGARDERRSRTARAGMATRGTGGTGL